MAKEPPSTQIVQDAVNASCHRTCAGHCSRRRRATKFITVHVEGGESRDECMKIGKSIANSPLVKTAFFASDPNLGRILAAIGKAGIKDLDTSKSVCSSMRCWWPSTADALPVTRKSWGGSDETAGNHHSRGIEPRHRIGHRMDMRFFLRLCGRSTRTTAVDAPMFSKVDKLAARLEALIGRVEHLLPDAEGAPDWDRFIAFRWRPNVGAGMLRQIGGRGASPRDSV